jgi:hypothetical protein
MYTLADEGVRNVLPCPGASSLISASNPPNRSPFARPNERKANRRFIAWQVKKDGISNDRPLGKHHL